MTVIGEGQSRNIHLDITTNTDPTSPDPIQLNLRHLHCKQGEGTSRRLSLDIANIKLPSCIPQDQIEATVRETWAGLKAMAREIAPEFGIYL